MRASQAEHLKGRVALVTGGARGIGFAISRDFVNRGARVLIADNGGKIDGTSADRTIAGTAANILGESAMAHAKDVGTAAAAAEAVQVAMKRWGRLDLVVNCAAILRDHFIFKARTNDFDEVLRVNLASAYYLLAAAAPVFANK